MDFDQLNTIHGTLELVVNYKQDKPYKIDYHQPEFLKEEEVKEGGEVKKQEEDQLLTTGARKGTLTVYFRACNNLVKNEKQQDPYLIATINNQKFQSNTITNGGINPEFDQTYAFNIDTKTIETEVLNIKV